MAISIKSFDGEYPRTLPHLLPDNAAQGATNCDFTQNALTGLRVRQEISHNIPQATLVGSHQSLFSHNGKMLVFPSESDVCRSPIADDRFDRVYWTQDFPGYNNMYVISGASLGFPPGGLIGQSDTRISRVGVPASDTAPSAAGYSGEFSFSMSGSIPVDAELIVENADGGIVSQTPINWATAGGAITSDTAQMIEWAYSTLAIPSTSTNNASTSAATASTSNPKLPTLPSDYAPTDDIIVSTDQRSSRNFSAPGFSHYVGYGSGYLGQGYDYYFHYADWVVAPIASVVYSFEPAAFIGTTSGEGVFTPMYHLGSGWYCTSSSGALPNDGGASLFGVSAASSSSAPAITTSVALRVTFGLRTAGGVITERRYQVVLRQNYANSSFPIAGYSGGISIVGGKLTANVAHAASAQIESRAYVYTFVNQFGEEGPPSPPLLLDVMSGDDVVINIPGSSGSYSFSGFPQASKIRLYRSATGDSTNFLFVDEISTGSTTLYTDSKPTSELGESLSSQGYWPPPSALTGLCLLPNGIFAAFKGNEVWFSEPYLPYAWNPDNVMTTLEDIVSICPTEGGMYITTKAHPYFVSGVTPDAMAQMKLTSIQAGASKNGICNMGPAVVWASHDGLVTARGLDASLDLSYRFFTRGEWRDLYGDRLNQIRLNAHDGHLVATFADGSPGFVMRFDETNPTFTKLGYGFHAMTTWTVADALIGITVVNGQYKIMQFAYSETGIEATENFDWRSKDFILPKPGNFGVAQLVGSGAVTFELYADGVKKMTKVVTINQIGTTVFRLPAGFLARRWSFRLFGNGRIDEMTIAVSPQELQGV